MYIYIYIYIYIFKYIQIYIYIYIYIINKYHIYVFTSYIIYIIYKVFREISRWINNKTSHQTFTPFPRLLLANEKLSLASKSNRIKNLTKQSNLDHRQSEI